MDTVEGLTESIEQYKSQLAQINAAIDSAPETQKADLLSLKRDIEELLQLTEENLDNLNGGHGEEPAATANSEDQFADEYALFKAELENLENNEAEGGSNDKSCDDDGSDGREEEENGDIQDDFDELIGNKCQAPYTSKNGSTGYHNALICGVEFSEEVSDLNHIKVRVMFTNPTEKDMVPCPFYLDNKCTFENKCKYSHGELVPFSLLKEYREPDFSSLKSGSRVLAKLGDHLWELAVVEDITDTESCTVKHEGRFVEVQLHNIFPLTFNSDDTSQTSDLSSDDEVEFVKEQKFDNRDFVEVSLTRDPATEKLGGWEMYTKGIGSKLMAKMGYVVGTGLGKTGEGILEPVVATYLPAGKSLDHCMQLKEAAGGSKDLFSAEKIQQKMAMKELRRTRRIYQRQKNAEKHNVFNVINKLSSEAGPSKKKVKMKDFRKKLATQSCRELNIERFKVAEDIRNTQRSIHVLEESLSRQKAGSVSHKSILSKLNSARGQLSALQNFDGRVEMEQSLRDAKKKLTIF